MMSNDQISVEQDELPFLLQTRGLVVLCVVGALIFFGYGLTMYFLLFPDDATKVNLEICLESSRHSLAPSQWLD